VELFRAREFRKKTKKGFLGKITIEFLGIDKKILGLPDKDIMINV
jgi:hypothetical protein